jgi:hypothetical protein
LRGGVGGGGAPRAALSVGDPLPFTGEGDQPKAGGGGGHTHGPGHSHHDHHHPYPHANHPLGPVTLPKVPGKRAREEQDR